MKLIKKLSQVKNLPELKPDAEWLKATKYNLLAEISSQNKLMKAQSLDSREKWSMFGMNFGVRMMSSAGKFIAAFLILSLGSGVGFAAQASVPGEALWPVKRSLEKAEVTLTFSPVKETEVHIKHVNNRLYEIDKILNEDNQNQDQKEKAIKQAVKHLEKDVVAADSSLKVAKEEKDPIAVVSLAEKVSNASKETSVTLKEKADNTNDLVIEQVLDSAKKVNEDVKTSAVSLAIEVHQEVVANAAKQDPNPSISASTSTATSSAKLSNNNPKADEVKAVTEVVTNMLTSEIKDLSGEVQGVKDQVGTVDKKNLNILSQTVTNTKSDNKAIADVNALKKTPEAAQAGLEQAKDLLGQGNLKDTLDKIVEVKEQTHQAETALKQIEKLTDSGIKSGEIKNDNTNNTSTGTSTPIKINATTTSSTNNLLDSKRVRSTATDEVLPDSSLDIKVEDGINTSSVEEIKLNQ